MNAIVDSLLMKIEQLAEDGRPLPDVLTITQDEYDQMLAEFMQGARYSPAPPATGGAIARVGGIIVKPVGLAKSWRC